MRLITTFTAQPRFRKITKWAAISLAAYAFIGFVVLPPIIKSVLISKLSEKLHRQVAVRDISINPFALSVSVKGVVVKTPDGKANFVSFDELYVNLQSLSLVKKGVILKEIRLARPYFNIVRNEDLTYNFSDLMETKEPKSKEPMRFSLNNIRIIDGSVDFTDGPVKKSHKLTGINVSVPFVSNLDYYADSYVQPSFSAVFNGTPVALNGDTKPFADSLETRFDVKLKDLDIPYYLAYSPVKMGFKVPSGLLDTDLVISYKQYKDKRPPTLIISGDVVIKKFAVTETGGSPLVGLSRLAVSIRSANVITRDINVNQVIIDSPSLNVVRDENGKINLLSVLPEKQAAPEKDAAPPAPLSLSVNFVKLSNGSVSFYDKEVKGGFKAALKPIDLTVVNFSNTRDWKTTVGLGIKTDAGEDIKFNGEVVAEPLKANGTLSVGNIPLKRYAPYYSGRVAFDIEDGTLDISTGIRYSSVKESPEMLVHDLSVSLASLRLKKRDEKSAFLDIPELSVQGTSVDLVNKVFTLGGLYTKGGFVGLKRFKDGNLNVSQLVITTETPKAKPAPHTAADKEKPWEVNLKSVSLDSWTLRMEDLWPPDTATLTADRLKFDASDLSTVKGATGRVSLSFRPNGKGSASLAGTASVNPVALKMKVNLKDVVAGSMQPYFSDRIKIIVTDGKVAAKGDLDFGYTQEKGLRLRYLGDVSMYDFASIDKQNADDFIKWKALKLGGMDVSYSPNRVSIKEVSLADFSSTIIMNPDKTLNVLKVFEQAAPPGEQAQAAVPAAPQPPPAPAPAASAVAPPVEARQAWPVKVDKITFQGGRINVTDRSISPSFTSSLSEIGGSVTGLSSEEIKMADLDLRGVYGGSAPIVITGRLNPLRKDLYVDLKVRFTGMDLSPVTPYSGKYLGYQIAKGKLSLDLKYLIDKKDLNSENNIFIDQLTLGNKVENPDATKLPVKLALALLRDRNGEIHLDVPVTGKTDDPKFSIAKILIQIIWNVIVKAVTSPFALLGSIFGGGEELGYVEFGYGSSIIDDQSVKKLDTLAKALNDRPALKLSVEGHVDPEKDGEALRQYIFNKKLKAQKLKDMIKEGQAAVPVDDVVVAPDEYDKYLKAAYKAEDFPKPRNIIGFAKSLPSPEMEKLMLTNIKVTDDDLRQLANTRSQKVIGYLLGTGKAGQERVFLVEPKSLAPEKKEGPKSSRVDFTLE